MLPLYTQNRIESCDEQNMSQENCFLIFIFIHQCFMSFHENNVENVLPATLNIFILTLSVILSVLHDNILIPTSFSCHKCQTKFVYIVHQINFYNSIQIYIYFDAYICMWRHIIHLKSVWGSTLMSSFIILDDYEWILLWRIIMWIINFFYKQ